MASPTGGVFSGQGVTGSTYTPGTTSNTSDTLQYKFTNAYGCTDSTREAIRIDSVPVVSLSNLPTLCSRDSITLTQGMPQGGSYSGVGVTGNTFNPNNTAGRYAIHYSYIDQRGCADSTSDTLTVKQSPTASISTLPTICANTPDFTLTQGSPQGGIYLGGMIKTDSIFSAQQVGSGQHTLKYAYTDTNSCTDTATQLVNIDTVPVVGINTIPTLCDNQAIYQLVEGFPQGGIYKGTGVVNDTTFNPTIGAGTYNISYHFTNGKGCADSSNAVIRVDSVQKVQEFKVDDICAYGDTIKLREGTPAGGIFTGKQVLINSLYISSIPGKDTVFYVLTNVCGSDSMAATFNVYPLPEVSISATPVICENQGNYTLTEGLPIGGDYYVNGQKQNFIDETAVGSNTVQYYVTDSLGCVGAAEMIARVKPKPIIQLKGNLELCSSDTLTLSIDDEFDHFVWNGDTASDSYTQMPWDLTFGSSTVSLKVVDSDGCYNEDILNISVKNCGNPFEVFPNPSNGQFQLKLLSDTEKEAIITITNSIGQKILEQSPLLSPGSNLYDVVAPLGAGTYILKVEMDGETYWDKIVVR
jgi:hypothetical protein